MNELNPPQKVGIKIERPKLEERVSFIYYLLMFAALVLISLVLWVLVLEFRGKPLPYFLKFPVT